MRNEPLAAATVQSVLDQKGLDLECVVVDGASTDGTLAALAPFASRIRLLSEPDQGIYDAMNKGLRMATGDVVGFLNAGDTFVGDRNLAALALAFQANPALGACFGGLEIADDQGRIRRWWPAEEYKAGAFESGWMPSHPTFYARRQSLLDLGGFNTRYRLAADYDLMLRSLAVAGLPSQALGVTLVRMRAGGASQASLRAMWQHNREAWTAARTSGVYQGGFAGFVARKIGRKLPQLLARPRP